MWNTQEMAYATVCRGELKEDTHTRTYINIMIYDLAE